MAGIKKEEIVLLDFETKEDAIKHAKATMYGIKSMELKWRDDKDVVMAAVKKFGGALEFASERLRADREIVEVAIKTDPRALMFASRELRDDIKLRNYVYSKGGKSIIDPRAWDRFQKLDNRMLNATISEDEIYINGRNLNFETLCKVLREAKENGNLENVGASYGFEKGAFDKIDFNKPKKLESFIKKQGDVAYSEEKTIKHPTYQRFKKFYAGEMTATEVIELERELVAETITDPNEAIEFLSNINSSKCFSFFNENLRAHKDVVMKAVEIDGEALQYASKALRGNREVVKAAIKSNPYALVYASEKLRMDPSLRKLAYERAGVFVVDPTLRKGFENMEKAQEQSRIKRPKKEFTTRADREKFITKMIVGVAYEGKQDVDLDELYTEKMIAIEKELLKIVLLKEQQLKAQRMEENEKQKEDEIKSVVEDKEDLDDLADEADND